jgi:hypothetical protein
MSDPHGVHALRPSPLGLVPRIIRKGTTAPQRVNGNGDESIASRPRERARFRERSACHPGGLKLIVRGRSPRDRPRQTPGVASNAVPKPYPFMWGDGEALSWTTADGRRKGVPIARRLRCPGCPVLPIFPSTLAEAPTSDHPLMARRYLLPACDPPRASLPRPTLSRFPAAAS